MPIVSGPGVSFGDDPRTMIARVGPCIPITISLPKIRADAVVQAGGVVSTSATHGLALIDTGCSVTSIDDEVAKALGLETISATTVHTAGGTRQANQYLAHAELAGSVSEVLTMTGASLAAAGILALIGTDLLMKCLLVYDGPGGRFSLAL